MALNIQHITVCFGSKTILNDVTFPTIQLGEIVSLIGSNGAGKSTLLKQITDSLWHRKPSIFLFDKPICSLDLGYLPQDHRVNANLSVLELLITTLNIHTTSLLMKKGGAETALALLNQMNIEHLANKCCTALSGGESQMVGLAQAIINRPKVLVLDEPTSALDMSNQLKLLDFVKKYAKKENACVIMVVHDLNLAIQYSDKIAVLHQGHLFEYGDPKQVITPEMLAKVFQVRSQVFDIDGTPHVVTRSSSVNSQY